MVPESQLETTTQARLALRRYVAQPTTRSSLRVYIRRRGFFDDADDLVQTVLSDALAVQAVPAESEDCLVGSRASRAERWPTSVAVAHTGSTKSCLTSVLRRTRSTPIEVELKRPEMRVSARGFSAFALG